MDSKIYDYDFDFNDMNSSGVLSCHCLKSHLTISRNLLKNCTQVFENFLNVKSEIRRMILKVMKKTIFLEFSTIIHKIMLQKIANFPTRNNKSFQEDLEDLREKLFQKIKILSCIFSKHSAQALNLCIFLFSFVFPSFVVNISNVKLFHLLHWQIKGKHSTDFVFEGMQAQYLNPSCQYIIDNANVNVCPITTFKQLSTGFDRITFGREAKMINTCSRSTDQANICIASSREERSAFEDFIYQSRKVNKSIGYQFGFAEKN